MVMNDKISLSPPASVSPSAEPAEQFSRSERLFGQEAMERLYQASVAVFGIGGVGGYVVEALARGGIGKLCLVDADDVEPSNLNRQIIALHDTTGMPKVEAAEARVHAINPSCAVRICKVFFLPENAGSFDFSGIDYIVDAVDTVSAKIALICRAHELGIPVISAMGAGNKLDPTAFRVADLKDTSVCPLAKVMRRELKARGIEHLKVVYSLEAPMKPLSGDPRTPASCSFVPGAAGLIIGGEVIKDIAFCRTEQVHT